MANLVPIAVPRICFKVFLPKVKALFFSTTSASSTSVEVLTFLSLLNSNILCRPDRPSSCGVLGYKPATSTEHKIISLGKSVKERSFFKKSLVSFM